MIETLYFIHMASFILASMLFIIGEYCYDGMAVFSLSYWNNTVIPAGRFPRRSPIFFIGLALLPVVNILLLLWLIGCHVINLNYNKD